MLDVSQENFINEIYPTIALFMNSNDVKVTGGAIIDVMKSIGIKGQPRIAKIFEMEQAAYDNIIVSATSKSSETVAVTQVAAADAAPAAVEDAEEEEDEDFDFANMF